MPISTVLMNQLLIVHSILRSYAVDFWEGCIGLPVPDWESSLLVN